MIQDYDFSCYVIKFEKVSINRRKYKKDSIQNENHSTVPLINNHQHFDPGSVVGRAVLEMRDDGIFVYGTLTDTPYKKVIIDLINDGELYLSPFINKVKMDSEYITNGIISEVSLVLARIDPDDCYKPILKEKE